MTIDLNVEKKIVLTVEQLSALRLMLRVDMVYKTQQTITGAVKHSTEKMLEAFDASEAKGEPVKDKKAAISQVADVAGREAMVIAADHVETWHSLDRPLLRSMELAGYITAESAKPESKVAVFVNDTTFNALKNVILTGFYNGIRMTANMEGKPSDSGAALGSALMKNRQSLIEAFNAVEVPAQDVQSGLFTFAQPTPKGTFAN